MTAYYLFRCALVLLGCWWGLHAVFQYGVRSVTRSQWAWSLVYVTVIGLALYQTVLDLAHLWHW